MQGEHLEGNTLACTSMGAAIDRKAAGFRGGSTGHCKSSCFSCLAFFFFPFPSASRKAVTYFSKLFCYVRVIQSNLRNADSKGFFLLCPVCRPRAADGREVLVSPEIRGTVALSSSAY